MDAQVSAEAWADEMLLYVATVRPNLSPQKRQRQKQTLSRFRTLHFNRIDPGFDSSWKRGILFESLVQSDPRYPEPNKTERKVSSYLQCVLEYDLLSLHWGRLRFPDDIIVRISKGTAYLVSVVEIKLDPRHWKVDRQLKSHAANMQRLALLIGDQLVQRVEPPECKGTNWPKNIDKLEVASNIQQVLIVPDGIRTRYPEWRTIQAPFTVEEVGVVSDFLWHIGKKEVDRVVNQLEITTE